MSVANKSYDGNAQELAELAQTFGKDRCCSAKRIPGFGIDDRHITVFDGTDKLPYKSRIVGEFSFTDASHIPQKLFSSDESVYRNNVIGSPWVYRLGGNFKVHKSVMITQKHEGRF